MHPNKLIQNDLRKKIAIGVAITLAILTILDIISFYSGFSYADNYLFFLTIPMVILAFLFCGFAETNFTILPSTFCDSTGGIILFGALTVILNALIGYFLVISTAKVVEKLKK